MSAISRYETEYCSVAFYSSSEECRAQTAHRIRMNVKIGSNGYGLHAMPVAHLSAILRAAPAAIRLRSSASPRPRSTPPSSAIARRAAAIPAVVASSMPPSAWLTALAAHESPPSTFLTFAADAAPSRVVDSSRLRAHIRPRASRAGLEASCSPASTDDSPPLAAFASATADGLAGLRSQLRSP
jgi:hypothetical protein